MFALSVHATTVGPGLCRPRGRARQGFSLLEVLFAMVVLVSGVLAANRLIDMGLEAADLSRAQSVAMLLAESKMAELEAGLADSSAAGGELEDHPGFSYKIETGATRVDRLTRVKVKITYPYKGRDAEYVLTRWLFQPTERGGLF